MAAGRVRTIPVQYLILEALDVEPGHWCRRCMLPSVCRIHLVSQVVLAGVVQPMKMSIGWRCDDGCGWVDEPTD